MSEIVSASVLTQMLDRLPGVTFCSRMDPATGKSTWLYMNKRAAELYDVPEDQLMADPNMAMDRLAPEDRARLEVLMGQLAQSGGSMVFVGKMIHRSGDVRWMETHATIEKTADGTLLWYGQSLDVTERKKLEEEQARMEALQRALIEALPLGITVMSPAGGFLIYNPAQEAMSGRLPTGQPTDDMMSAFGVFRADGVTPFPDAEMPIVRVLSGQDTAEDEMILRNAALESERRLRVHARPLRDGTGKLLAALAVSHDVTEQRRLEAELVSRNEELAQSEEAKIQLIERLRHAIDELSNPILEVWDGVLAMPIIGLVDSRRTADMVQRLLGEVTRMQASFVIIDLTGVDIVDTKTADHLMKLMRKVEIVGARCVLTGIRPAVAETLVDIGVDFGRLSTLRNLKHGLREALRLARRERDGLRDQDLDDDAAEESQPRRQRRS